MNFKKGAKRCRSDSACLLRIFEMVVTAKNLFAILKNLNPLVNLLFMNSANSDAAYRAQVRNVILKKSWGNEVLLDGVKESGIFSISRVKKLKRTFDGNEQLERRLRFPEKLGEARMLRGVQELKKKASIIDLILLVQICIGSRFVEVLFISQIEVSTVPGKSSSLYIRIIGIGKEQRESRRKNLEMYKAKRRKTNSDPSSNADEEMNAVSDFEPKEVIKPVLFGVSPQEIVDAVKTIREDVRKKVAGYDEIKRDEFDKIQKITNLYLQKAVARVFELFGYRQTHLLRRIYANWSYQTYGQLDMAQLAWFKLVLGHTSTNTSRAYTTLLITPIVRAENAAMTTLVGSIKTEQEMLKEELHSLKEELLLLHTFKNEPPLQEGYHNFWVTADNRWVTIQRATNEKVLETNDKIETMVLELTARNVPITNSNLRAVGFGSRIILKWNEWKKKNAQKTNSKSN